jgi:hypothetical protein
VKGELITEDQELYTYNEKGKPVIRETLDKNGKTLSRLDLYLRRKRK